MSLPRIILAAALALVAAAASAQSQTTYRCVGKDGKKYYGSAMPTQCIGQVIEQLSPQGTVIRRIAPTVEETEEERAAKEAAAAKKREEDHAAREESRRNRALLATYTSEKDIEDARVRAIAENEKAAKAIEVRIADIKKRQAGFDKEMEFYKETPKAVDKNGKAKPEATGKPGPKAPPKLLEDIQQAQIDLAAQENLLLAKRKETDAINAKYDEDKKRYLELTGKSKPRGK